MTLDAKVYREQQAYGRGSRGLCIPDPEVHHARLQEAVAALAGVSGSLADLGCGFGDLAALLPDGLSYVGVDVTPWILAAGQLEYPHLRLIQADAIAWLDDTADDAFDAVCALGMLTTTLPGHLPVLLAGMRRVARQRVVVSWLDRSTYIGRFKAWRKADITRYLGKPRTCTQAEGDLEWTGAFET